MQEILDALVQAGVLIVIAIIGYLSTWATKFINAKKEQIKSQVTNDNVKLYVELASRNALQIVETLNSTMVDGLKASAADGKLTEAEIKLIRDTARTKLRNTLSTEVQDTLTQVFGNFDEYLDTLIEMTVVRVKKEIA